MLTYENYIKELIWYVGQTLLPAVYMVRSYRHIFGSGMEGVFSVMAMKKMVIRGKGQIL